MSSDEEKALLKGSDLEDGEVHHVHVPTLAQVGGRQLFQSIDG